MPWIYHQQDGDLYHNKTYVGWGWSGHGTGKNKPDWQSRPNIGPIPRGKYGIEPPFDYRRTKSHPHGTGPYSMRLVPDPRNRMFGRSGFLIHGASTNSAHFGQESDGCVILSRSLRSHIWASGDHTLEVLR